MARETHAPRLLWSIALVAAVRAAFGMVWAIDAFLTWRPGFALHYVGYLQNASQGQPGWLEGWFRTWLAIVDASPDFFIWSTRIVETLIAAALLTGFARRWTYVFGGLFSLLVWATAEGFSGPYVTGAANLGPALVYVLVFALLWLEDRIAGRTPYSVDFYLERRVPWWKRFSESAPEDVLERTPPELSWTRQGSAIAAIVVALVLLFGGLRSALAVPAATPENAAAAVSPLQLASQTPEPSARDARLPPLLGDGDRVKVTLESSDVDVKIANGVTYAAWTFGGMVPAPILHVRVGQTVDVTLTNHGTMPHSIDFHAAEIAPNVAYKSIDPGQTISFSFVPRVPGAFIYHCGTPSVLLHMSNGMYGAIIVDPPKPLPPADVSYVLVQSEWYTEQLGGTRMGGNWAKMKAAQPDEVVFNGVAFQYKDHPLPAHVGKRVRLYVVDAGPNLSTAFHVIGGIFESVYVDGDPTHALKDVSTYGVAPGQGVVFDVVLPEAGEYAIVDHSMRDMDMGAVGLLKAE